MKLNDLRSWPHLHVCPFDRSCWADMWRYGMPMRVYLASFWWDIPGPLAWLAAWRTDVVWDPVPVLPARPRTAAEPKDDTVDRDGTA